MPKLSASSGPFGSALDLLPLVDPLVVGRAAITAAVDALLLRRCPVVDFGCVLFVGRVVDVAEVLLAGVFARLGLCGCLTEVFGDLGIDLGEVIQSIHLYMQFGCAAF